MNYATRIFACALSFFACFSLSAQNPNLLLDAQNSDTLFVCGIDTFTVTVQNTGGALNAGASMSIALPGGVEYLANTVSGATQFNISNLQSPVFTLPAIPANGQIPVKILLTAGCSAADRLDSGKLFIAQISIVAPNASASASAAIPVETGLLLITNVDSLLTGERGDTVYRTICVKNTRVGKISRLHFEDSHHQPGFEVAVALAATQTNTIDFFEADFDPAFFTAAGNGDIWLDKDESVCFTERIIITDCGMPEYLNKSLLRVGWGCGPELCRYDSVYVNIRITPSTKIPDLVLEQIWNPPTDNCAHTGATLGLKIRNAGRGDADNVSIRLVMAENPNKMSMAPATFRLVSSSGTITPISPNLTTPSTLLGCAEPAAKDVSVTVPFLATKDSLNLLFEMLNCVESCNQEFPLVYVEFFYRKPCPVNGFVSDTMLITSDKRYFVSSKLNMAVGNCLQSGQTYPVRYLVRSKRLLEPGGFLNVEFELPHGITLDPNCSVQLGSTAPLSATSNPIAAGGTLVHFTYALPFPHDTAVLDLCLHYECDSNMVCVDPPLSQGGILLVYGADCTPCFSNLNERTYWAPDLNTPYNCAIGNCNSLLLALDATCSGQNSNGGGDTAGIAPVPVAGYRWKMDVSRTNFGLRDQTNDREADDGSTALAQEIRLDRYLPGDTSRVSYCGVLDSGEMTIFQRLIWHEVTNSDLAAQWGNDQFDPELTRFGFTNSNNLRFIHDSLRIRYANGQVVAFPLNDLMSITDQNAFAIYTVNTAPPELEDLIVSQRHLFRISLPDMFSQGLLPKPTLNPGDSIFFYTDFKMDMNFNQPEPGKTDPPLIGFRTAVDHNGGKFAWNFHPFQRMQYSGFITRRTPHTFSIKPCDISQEAKQFKYSIRIARENLFPFEVRPLGRIVQYGQTVPNGLTVLSAKLDSLILQHYRPWATNIQLPFSQSPGLLNVDFSPVFAQPLDEGFALKTSITFAPECRFALPDSSKQWVSTQYNLCLKGEFPLVTDTIRNTLGFFASHPELSISSTDSVVSSPTRPFQVNFDLYNPVVSPAAHPWITVQSPSGLATDFELFKTPQNQAIAPQNGFFNLPAIAGRDTVSFRLKGKNLSCETDTLLIIFGWDCNPVADLNQSSCFRDTYVVRLKLELPELDLSVVTEPPSITLCDTSSYFEFEFFNANDGYAYELFASASLPDGLQIVPGSSQLFYPPVGAWATIPDPDLLPGHLFRWDVGESQDSIQTNGLPGQNHIPVNSNIVRIRFRTIAECGFVANNLNIYGAYGKDACGRSTNILNKPGMPINIQGLSPTYGVDVQVFTGNQENVCGGEREFDVDITLHGTASSTDSAVVTLPQGVTYVAGSYVPGLNAVQPVFSPSGFKVPLPVLSGSGSLKFKFKVAFGAGSGCLDQTISIQTLVHTQAFCQTLNAPCDVYVSTGIWSLTIQVQHPELTVQSVQTTLNSANPGISVNIHNTGAYNASGVVAQVWQDLDANQMVSPGDLLLQTLQSDQTIGPNGNLLLTGVLNIDPDQRCGLMIVLPAAENCTCADVVFPVESLSIGHVPLIICNFDPVSIGTDSLDGFQYHWQTNTGIVCDTCAMTAYNPDPNLPAGQAQTLVLTESAAGCTVVHQFEVSFGVVASIAVNNAVICSGQAVTLEAAPPGAMYHWEGPGVLAATDQIQNLQPPVGPSQTYTVTVSLANGCSATASAVLTVLAADTIFMPRIEACEGEQVPVFGVNELVADSIFHVSGTNVNGCDSTTFQPVGVLHKYATAQTIKFCKGETITIFDTIPVSTSTQVCLHFTAANTCDSLHCITTEAIDPPDLPEQDTIFSHLGEPIELGGLSGYTGYDWMPAPDPPCNNCSTITVMPVEEGFYEYHLTVADSIGCSDEVIWRLVVFPPCDPEKVHIPNAFTPNGDGFNDEFRPVPSEGGEVLTKLTIYDRWGAKVFEGLGNASWDGTINGKDAPSDVYVYIMEFDCSGERVPQHGEVTLLR